MVYNHDMNDWGSSRDICSTWNLQLRKKLLFLYIPGIFVKNRIQLLQNGPCCGNTKKQSRKESCENGAG